MRDRVRRLFSPIGTWATKLESWLALGAMISGWGFFTWLGNQWTDLAAYGWAAVMFFALGVTCIVVIVASIFLVALRYFHPIPRHLLPFDPSAYSHDSCVRSPEQGSVFQPFGFCSSVSLARM